MPLDLASNSILCSRSVRKARIMFWGEVDDAPRKEKRYRVYVRVELFGYKFEACR